MERFEAYELREICIKHNWFTGGTNQQYEKLFELSNDGADFEELALVIWLCSPEVTRDEVEAELHREILRKKKREALAMFESFEEMDNERFRVFVDNVDQVRRDLRWFDGKDLE